MPPTTTDEVRAVYRTSMLETKRRFAGNGDAARWTKGTVRTPDGIVEVFSSYAYDGESSRVVARYTLLTATRDGRQYERRIDAAYSERYLVTLAKRFASDVASGALGPPLEP